MNFSFNGFSLVISKADFSWLRRMLGQSILVLTHQKTKLRFNFSFLQFVCFDKFKHIKAIHPLAFYEIIAVFVK